MKSLAAAVLVIQLLNASAQAADYYKVEVTRKSDDLYQIGNTGTYIKTRYCYEYVYGSTVILRIDSNYGYNVGEIMFVEDGGGKCDVEKLLR